jgi:uncharacterized membrane protein YagU involved in acid resistance
MKRIVFSGLAGLIAISVYLVVALQFVLHTAAGLQLFQWDASNALGPAAFAGGWETAALGLLMDVPVSLAWSATFVLVVERISAARAHAVVTGVLFGAVVMVVMHWVVVPLGHASEGAPSAIPLLNELIAHTLFFGVPIALVAAKVNR